DVDATFVPRPGLRRPGWRTVRPNLAIAGAWTDTGWPATMESAVRSGRAAAAGVSAATSGVTPTLERAHA
ncbi:MAG: FAD-dependent oxidoreductase, partial [Candidatus Dormibacteraeota bacterium]|nr:FAD-dependent oxidoreductase [Candidatus Dormibacteraeota bacterium]